MWVHVLRFCRDRAGATALEYAWIGVFISIVVFASSKYMGSWVAGVFSTAAGNLSSQ
ncbi:MAG TPA: Flp family type IVb pilin [Methylocystis sp.]|nr:Flp family type IVb pilin [Methylocystis sp.]